MSKFDGPWIASKLGIFDDEGFCLADITKCFLDEEDLAKLRLIASAPEMYYLLCEMVKIHDQKQEASTSNNDSAFMMALMAQDGAINKARELLARINNTEAQ